MINIRLKFIKLFVGIKVKNFCIIDTFFNTTLNMLLQFWHIVHTPIQLLASSKQEQTSSNKLIVGVVQVNQVRSSTNQNLLNLCGSNTIIKLNTRLHLNLTCRDPCEVFTRLLHHNMEFIQVKRFSSAIPLDNLCSVAHIFFQLLNLIFASKPE